MSWKDEPGGPPGAGDGFIEAEMLTRLHGLIEEWAGAEKAEEYCRLHRAIVSNALEFIAFSARAEGRDDMASAVREVISLYER